MQNMKKKQTISIVIPAYNEQNYIWDCLDSIMRYCVDFIDEVLVIDNASTDNTANIVKQYPMVRYIKENNKWLVRARQRGYIESTGDIIAYIDADTRVWKDWIHKVIKEFETNKKLVFLSGAYDYYDMEKWKKIWLWLYRYMLAYPSYLVTWYLWIGGNMIMRRSMLDRIWWFDTDIEFYGEDTNIARRAYQIWKCKFMLDLMAYTSARRLKKQWIFNTIYIYITNFLSQSIIKKSIHNDYQDHR